MGLLRLEAGGALVGALAQARGVPRAQPSPVNGGESSVDREKIAASARFDATAFSAAAAAAAMAARTRARRKTAVGGSGGRDERGGLASRVTTATVVICAAAADVRSRTLNQGGEG